MASIVLDWLKANRIDLIISAAVILIGLILIRIIGFELKRLVKNNRIKKRGAKAIQRMLQLLILLIIFTVLLVQYLETAGFLTALITLMGTTVIGFAAMNTIGNFIAGIIIMTSKPFIKGDRIFFEGKLADIVDIEFIYTKIQLIDKTIVAVPNQELLRQSINNLGSGAEIIMRDISVTLDYSLNHLEVEETLVNAIKGYKLLSTEEDPFVTINDYHDYAVEYKLYYYIKDVMQILIINSEIRKRVLEACEAKGYKISVPLLIKDTE
ncbi:MAG: mechanosensitive ion channel [Asgard group archaeon]|nr:mechanosensitive ion channel [Asgard group archaeon]